MVSATILIWSLEARCFGNNDVWYILLSFITKSLFLTIFKLQLIVFEVVLFFYGSVLRIYDTQNPKEILCVNEQELSILRLTETRIVLFCNKFKTYLNARNETGARFRKHQISVKALDSFCGIYKISCYCAHHQPRFFLFLEPLYLQNGISSCRFRSQEA